MYDNTKPNLHIATNLKQVYDLSPKIIHTKSTIVFHDMKCYKLIYILQLLIESEQKGLCIKWV